MFEPIRRWLKLRILRLKFGFLRLKFGYLSVQSCYFFHMFFRRMIVSFRLLMCGQERRLYFWNRRGFLKKPDYVFKLFYKFHSVIWPN